MGDDIKNGGVEAGAIDGENKGLSQAAKEDIQTYVALLLVVILGTILTIIKIVTIDIHNPDYSNIFYPDGKNESSSLSSTSSPTAS